MVYQPLFEKISTKVLKQHPSGQVVLQWDEQVQGVLGEELAEQQGSKGCGEWGYLWLMTGHQQCSSRFNTRASSVRCIYK